VLLHSLLALQPSVPIHAIHVHHGLHAAADGWARFCEELSREWNLPLAVVRVDARAPRGESPEGWARVKRYEALYRALEAEEALLTAHHQQDQAETLLLQLLRGAGPAGLAAMPACSRVGGGWHLRPLLDVAAATIADYAAAAGLRWVEDHSNQDPRFDRNFLRQRVFPVLSERWPHAGRGLGRAARWQAEARVLLDELAMADLPAAAGSQPGLLSVAKLLAVGGPRRRNVLRAWIGSLGLPIASATQLEQVEAMLRARRDALSCVRWRGVEVRRYRDDLHAMPTLPVHDGTSILTWNPLVAALFLPVGSLHATLARGGGISRRAVENKPLTVRFRRGGERCRINAAGPSRMLKHLLQEWGVPPWMRERLPLVYAGEELAAVADIVVCAPFAARADEEALRLRWEREPRLIWNPAKSRCEP
jgi:tRNA(Ile)-lysidine synthase